MEIVITEWAQQSYLELRNAEAFTRSEYKNILRPDAERLKNYPSDPKFKVHKFWGPAVDIKNNIISNGFKMKWHNMGNGKVQLRLLIVVQEDKAYLCNSYVKTSSTQDKREMEKLKIKINMIASGSYRYSGAL